MQHHKFIVGGFAMISVGIDVSKDKHDCFIGNSEGEVLEDVFTIPNSMEGFHCLLRYHPKFCIRIHCDASILYCNEGLYKIWNDLDWSMIHAQMAVYFPDRIPE